METLVSYDQVFSAVVVVAAAVALAVAVVMVVVVSIIHQLIIYVLVQVLVTICGTTAGISAINVHSTLKGVLSECRHYHESARTEKHTSVTRTYSTHTTN